MLLTLYQSIGESLLCGYHEHSPKNHQLPPCPRWRASLGLAVSPGLRKSWLATHTLIKDPLTFCVSGRRFRSLKSRTNPLKNRFYPWAVRHGLQWRGESRSSHLKSESMVANKYVISHRVTLYKDLHGTLANLKKMGSPFQWAGLTYHARPHPTTPMPLPGNPVPLDKYEKTRKRYKERKTRKTEGLKKGAAS
ncbi:unnamed protein product [Menidia menidia]|uniref:(Atlantic silverside) hypothetical protein n=1 Tax=Menidia menidia TaxID=238744 RepID=A0A8S4ANF8_9TELE|nr:unnamed protein product [Menidia menidia]